MNRFFITGGLGFVGINLVNLLAKAMPESQLCIFDLGKYPNRQRLLELPERCHIVNGDVRDYTGLKSAVIKFMPDMCVHLAAEHFIPDCRKDPQKTNDVNITGTANLIDAMMEVPQFKHFIFASSAAVYANSPTAHTENEPIASTCIYGNSKIAGEALLRDKFADKLKYTILRFFNVYGENDPVPHFIPELLRQASIGNNLHLGNLDSQRDYVHVQDIAQAILSAARHPAANDVYNVGSGVPTSGHEVIHILKIQRPDLRVFMDESRLRPSDTPILYSNISKAMDFLGWKPMIKFSQGLRHLAQPK